MARVPMMVILLMLSAVCVQAGPWPRERGETFIAPMIGAGTQVGAITQIYAEHGLTRRLTLGADVARRGRRADVEIFGRWHLRDLGRSRPVSASLGVVSSRGAGRAAVRPRLRPGVHIGQGFSRPGDGGWARLSLSALQPPQGGRAHLDLHAQLGLRAFRRGLFALGLGVYDTADATYLTFLPVVGWRVGARTTLIAEGGLGLDRDSRSDVDVTLGFWYSF